MTAEQGTLFGGGSSLISAASGRRTGGFSFAAWNVNSVRARFEHTAAYLREYAPDILCLQELKCTDEQFPFELPEDAGYNAAVHGQKTYNGVAVFSRFPISEVIRGLPGFEDEQARYLECLIETPAGPTRAVSVYVPNGASPDAPAFRYKLAFMDALVSHWRNLIDAGEPLLAGGDFNAMFDPARDAADPARSEGTICCHPEERARMHRLAACGLTDLFRAARPDERSFTWRDYRDRDPSGGLRIDYVLASPALADRAEDIFHDSSCREAERPSDHTPVRAVFGPPRG